MFSNSVILTDIMTTESCELKQKLNEFIDNKLQECKLLLQTNIDEIISDKVHSFYNPADNLEHEKILFDSVLPRFHKKTYISYSQYSERYDELVLDIKDTTCFNISYVKTTDLSGYGQGYKYSVKLVTFTKQYAIYSSWNEINNYQYNTTHSSYPRQSAYLYEKHHKHGMSIDQLFAVKHCQINAYVGTTLPTPEKIFTGSCGGCIGGYSTDDLNDKLQVLLDHPEYLKSKSNDFERICKAEYEQIERIKHSLELKIDEYNKLNDDHLELCSRLLDIEMENSILIDDLTALQNKVNELCSEKDELQLNLDKLSAENLELHEKLKKMEKMNKNPKKKLYKFIK